MKLLIKAAFRQSRHLPLICLTLLSLIGLTIGSQLEMFGLGLITDTGSEIITQLNVKDIKPKSKIQSAKKPAVPVKINPLTTIVKKLKDYLQLKEIGIHVLLIVLLGVVLFKAAFLFFSRYTTQLLSVRIARDLRQQYFEHIQKLPMSFYHKYHIGSLSSRVASDASQIALSLNAFITNYFHTPFRIAITLFACFWISWQLSCVIFFGLPMIVLPVIFLTKKVKNITKQLQKNQEKFTSVLIDFLAGIQTVKMFSMEPFSLKKYKEQNDQMAALESKTAKYDLLIRPILHTITVVCVIGIMLFGLYILKMSLSELLIFCGILHQFYEPVKKFSEENAIIQRGVVAAERLFEVLDIEPQAQDHAGLIEMKTFNNLIEFDHVWFRYEDRWVLKDVSFTVKKGETVAIVGSTGAGKSTVVQLLPRLYDVDQGEIRIDGTPIRKISKKSLRECISFVPQRPFLFYDTIAANIAFGKPFSKERIEMAARKAHADEFIECLANGYDTMLSETGKNLSGGQQQRLAIARALVKEAPILVLDEATSSLDAISESRIKDAITNLYGKITQIVIAHRLSTIEHADKIIFLEKGEKLAEGTKEHLLQCCPQFRLMWETHFLLPQTTKKELLSENLLPTS